MLRILTANCEISYGRLQQEQTILAFFYIVMILVMMSNTDQAAVTGILSYNYILTAV